MFRKNTRYKDNMKMTRMNYLSLPRSSIEDKKMFKPSSKFRETAPEPFRRTQQFYAKNKKTIKMRVSIDQPQPWLKDEHI